MRKLPLCLVLALLAFFACAAPAPALPDLLGAPSESAEETDEAEAGDEDESEAEEDGCTIEDEEDVQLCAEIASEERESEEAEECVLESADASVSASPHSGKVRLTVHYRAYGPASFSLSYSLRGRKGGMRLGGAEARFGRAGTFHDIVRVDERKLPKVLAAREFQIQLQAKKTPGHCRERLTVQRHGAGRAHWS
jgi:hypothetical protein